MIRAWPCRPAFFRRQGFTLTELAIVMLVVGLVTGGIWIAANTVWDNYRLYRATQQANTIIQNIRDQYSACQALPPDNCAPPFLATTGGIETATMDALNLFPIEMRRDPTSPGATPLDNPFNNDAALFPTGTFTLITGVCPLAGSVNVRCFLLYFSGLDQKSCIKMIVNAPVVTGEGIVQVGVNVAGAGSNAIMDDAHILNGVAFGGDPLPITVDMARTWCANANTGGTNQVYWEFKLHN